MSNPSFSRIATVRASTRRPPAVAGGLRGEPVTHLAQVYCTPLDPLQPELRPIAGLAATAELLQTLVRGAPDIREGDILVVAGREYPIRAVADWSWPAGADTTRLLIVEQPATDKWAEPGAAASGTAILTFADGYRSDASQAGWQMQRRGWAGLSLVVTTMIDGPARMTTEDVQQLVAWGWDVGSHGATHDDPRAMNPPELDEHLHRSRTWLDSNAPNPGAAVYAPPFGTDGTVNAAALAYYDYILPAELGELAVLPPGSAYAWQYAHDAIPLADVQSAIDLLIGDASAVLFVCFHRIVPSAPVGVQSTVARFKDVLAYIEAAGVNVRTLTGLL